MPLLMKRNHGISVGAALAGALFMYAMDRNSGRRRRAIARDKAYHYSKVLSHFLGRKSRHYSNLAYGTVMKLGLRRSRHHAHHAIQPTIPPVRTGMAA